MDKTLNTNYPQITVLMPVYNGAKYLAKAIESILNQSYKNFEFIIINDGSTDGSLEIIKSYRDNRITIYSQENKGLATTLNFGIQQAKGKYIARQDCDDISYPIRFQKQIDFFKQHSEISLLGTWCEIIDERAKSTNKFHKHPTKSPELKFFLLFDNPFVHSSVMFKKSIIDSIGNYSIDNSVFEDYNLWSRLSRVASLANLPEVLLKYREVSSGISQTTNDYSLRVKNQSVQNVIYCCPDWSLEKARHFINLSQGNISSTNIKSDIIFFQSALSELKENFNRKENINSNELDDLIKVQKIRFKRAYYNYMLYSSNLPFFTKFKIKVLRKLLFISHKNILN